MLKKRRAPKSVYLIREFEESDDLQKWIAIIAQAESYLDVLGADDIQSCINRCSAFGVPKHHTERLRMQ